MKYANLRRYLRQGTFTQMMVLEALERQGSMTRAADELCIAQPTASVRIRKLSDAIGVTLAESSGRGMRLTPAGREIAAAYRQIMASLGALDAALSAARAVGGTGVELMIPARHVPGDAHAMSRGEGT